MAPAPRNLAGAAGPRWPAHPFVPGRALSWRHLLQPHRYELAAVAEARQNSLLYFSQEVGNENGAAPYLGSYTSCRFGRAGRRPQRDLLAVTHAQGPGVFAVDLYEASGIVQPQNAIFALERLAVTHQHILCPVVKGAAKKELEGKLGGAAGLRRLGDRRKIELSPVAAGEQITRPQRLILGAGPLPPILAGQVLVTGSAVERNRLANLLHHVAGPLIVPVHAHQARDAG